MSSLPKEEAVYLTPKDWRWWFTIGINPQAIHDSRHYRKPVVPLAEVFDRLALALSEAITPVLADLGRTFDRVGRQLSEAFAPLLGPVKR